jgi:uncharacterized protein (TIGR00290 family)
MATIPPKAFVSWSSGKDCAFAVWQCRQLGLADVVGVLTTLNEEYDRVAMHGVRNELLDRQVAALGLPVLKVPLPNPCSNEVYEQRMTVACARMKAQGIEHVVFGDLFLEGIRAYREEKLAIAGMKPLFPIWMPGSGRSTLDLAGDMIESGMVAYLACIDPRKLDRSFAGRRFDRDLLRDLPPDVDPCGENGEFHTVVTAGPMFSVPIEVRVGAVVEREGFVFADVLPA